MALWATSGNERQEDLSRLICLIYRGDLRKLMAILAPQKRLIDFANHMMALLGMNYRRKCHGSVMLPNLHRDFKYPTVSFLLSVWIFQTSQRLTDTRQLQNIVILQLKEKSCFHKQIKFLRTVWFYGVPEEIHLETRKMLILLYFLLKTKIKNKPDSTPLIAALLWNRVVLAHNTGDLGEMAASIHCCCSRDSILTFLMMNFVETQILSCLTMGILWKKMTFWCLIDSSSLTSDGLTGKQT